MGIRNVCAKYKKKKKTEQKLSYIQQAKGAIRLQLLILSDPSYTSYI